MSHGSTKRNKKKGAPNMTLIITKSAVAFAVLIVLVGYLIGNFYPLTRGATSALQYPKNDPSGQSQGPLTQGSTLQNQSAVNLVIPSFAPYRGSNTSKLNLVEFGDYQCPFCDRFFFQTEPQIKSNYVDTGKIRFYFLDFQFLGPDSISLGQGAWCANEQGKYYDYHDYVYSHQGMENSGWAATNGIESFAANIMGLNTQSFNSCLDSNRYLSRVQNLTELGHSVGVRGTPSIFIGNDKIGYRSLVGAYPYSNFSQLIESQLSKVS